jgi:hypothetical protein
MADKYRARLAVKPCAHWPDQVVLDGPALHEMVREQFAELAYSIIDGDTRAESWGEYLVAVGNLAAAEREGVEETSLEYLADRVSMAWDALEKDLNTSLYLRMPDARAVTHVIDDVAGRVGIEGKRAA